MAHQTPIKVRGYHVDAYQHVNNARYLEFLEEARWAFTEERGLLEKLKEMNLGFVVVQINIRYRKPAVTGDQIVVESILETIKISSAVLRQTIHRQNSKECLVEAEVIFVIVDFKTERAVAITDRVRELLDRLRLA
jgi:thioesterase-3